MEEKIQIIENIYLLLEIIICLHYIRIPSLPACCDPYSHNKHDYLLSSGFILQFQLLFNIISAFFVWFVGHFKRKHVQISQITPTYSHRHRQLLCISEQVCPQTQSGRATQAALQFLHRGPLVLRCSLMWLQQCV